MYRPRSFIESDLGSLDDLFNRDAFVTLITTDHEGAPFASHLPVLYRRDGDGLEIRGHWARPNQQASHDGVALMIVHGAHSYISPSWYADPEHQVPTWNYAVAHLYGRLERFEDTVELELLVSELAEKYERAVGSTWRFPGSAPSERSAIRGIIGFRFAVDSLEMKFKLNQNHPAANIEGAAAALDQGNVQQREVAAMMRDQLRRPG